MTLTGLSVLASAPAKTNLLLRSGAAGEDGYHRLLSVFHTLDLRETVNIRFLEGGESTVRTVPGARFAGQWNADLDNRAHLALRAHELLISELRQGTLRVPDGKTPAAPAQTAAAIEIVKDVPIAGGMAGGSADACATLAALNLAWNLDLPRRELARLGAMLGADVPYGFWGGTSLGMGRGDYIQALERGEAVGNMGLVQSLEPWHWIFAMSRQGLSTPAVFRQFDVMCAAGELTEWNGDTPTEADLQAFTSFPGAAAAVMHNDLQPATLALRPELATVIAAAQRAGALNAQVSGSGPTIAVLAPNAAAAGEIAGELRTLPVVDWTVQAVGPGKAACAKILDHRADVSD